MTTATDKSFPKFLQDLLDGARDDMEVLLPAKIESFDSQKMTADVRPLAKRNGPNDTEMEYPVLRKLPVNSPALGNGFYFRPSFSKGDLVSIGFSQRDVFGPLRGTTPTSQAGPSIQNAFVIGGVQSSIGTGPSDWSKDGVLIGHEDGALIQFESDKITVHLSDTTFIEFNEANGIVATIAGIPYKIIHNHVTGVPGSPTGPTTPG